MSWTDHNVHDPGVTLLELFAFLAEALAYFSEEISGEQRRRTLGRYALALLPLGAVIFVCRRRAAASRLPG